MAAPALLLDEDVRVVLADILRQRGYDAIHVLEIGRAGRSDLDQFTYAVSQERALLTHNIRDFLAIDDRYRTEGHEHFGIMVSDHVQLRDLLRRILRCLSQYTKEQACNRVTWLQDYR